MENQVIKVRNLVKRFGRFVANDHLNFDVYEGEIFGFLGANGAGKTTVLHMVAGLTTPSEGKVEVLGQPVGGNIELYRRIGVMSEHEAVYTFLTGREFIEFSARLYGLKALDAAVDRAIALANLADAQNRPLGTYSRGMRQRMRLAAAMVHDPEVLLLDEPLNGTDPRQRLEFHEVITQLAAQGRTIVISSHILEEVETLAERILLMVSGKLAAAGDFRAIRAKLDERPYKVRVVSSSPRAMASSLVAVNEVESVSIEPDGALIVLSRNVAVLQSTLPKLAKERGIRLTRVEPLDESLESVFSYVVER